MIILAHPEWLILVPLLLGIMWLANRKASPEHEGDSPRFVLVHPNLSPLHEVKRNAVAASRLNFILHGLGLLLLSLALAQPQRIGDWIPENPEGREIVMLIDTSKTMSINDFELNGQHVERLTVLKGIVNRFIEARQGDRFGVIAFGTLAATLVPPTFDRELVAGMIRQVQVGMAGDDTAIGDAVGLALKQLRERQKLRPALILFTDGENTAGDISPREAVALSGRMGVPIYTVQIGDDPFAAVGGASTKSSSGDSQPKLEEIAQLTGGRYYRAGNAAALQTVVSDIGELEKTVARPSSRRNVQEWYLVPLLLAVCLFTVARFLETRRMET